MTIKFSPKYICRHAKDSNQTEIFDTETNKVIDSYTNFNIAYYECHQLNKKDPSYINCTLYKILEDKFKAPLNYYGSAYEPSLINDQRQARWTLERQEQGFDSTELWSLFYTITKFILPRLKAFRDSPGGYPMFLNSEQEWQAIIDKMIWSFEEIEKDACVDVKDIVAHEERIKEGLNLFAQYFRHLWN